MKHRRSDYGVVIFGLNRDPYTLYVDTLMKLEYIHFFIIIIFVVVASRA